MIYTDKKVLKCLLFYGLIVSLIIFILELIIHLGIFNYTISFIIGIITSFICFMIMSFTVTKLTDNPESKIKFYVFSSYLLRLIIYGVVMYLVYISPLKYGVFTCFFGFLSIRICILIVYNIIEKINDNKRKIDNLNIDVYIKDQLKKHNILYVKDLCEKSRKDLSEYLNEEEINKIIEALKEYELFIKGELEVIKDDDGS